MVADAIRTDSETARDEDMRTNVELEFELDEHDRVWMTREGDCYILGRKDAVCAEMRRFLRTTVLADDANGLADKP